MALLMGPVLALRGANSDSWDLSVLVVAEEKPADLRWSRTGAQGSARPARLWSQGPRTAYGFRFTVPLQVSAGSFTYEVADQTFEVALPGHGEPPRMAYASCNGFSDPKLMKTVDQNNRMWTVLAARHAQAALHLLIMGGDQVYADDLWRTIPEMSAFAEASFAVANAMACPQKLARRIEAFYFDLYVQRWSQPEVAAMLAVIPTVMMWDDHDIVDGWGSYPPERQDCPVFRDGIGPAATRAFQVFQRQQPAGAPEESLHPDAFSRGYTLGRIAILALDMRTERTIDQVLSPPHWDAVYAWLDGLRDIDHLLVMSSIPVVYPNLGGLEDLLAAFPGQQDLEDDLRDRWNSDGHRAERVRLVQRLLDFAVEKASMPTILSGDVHLATLGAIESRLHRDQAGAPVILFELTSSAIVHPDPGNTVLFALNHLADSEEEIETGIVGRNVTYPAARQKFIGARNFLTIEPDLDRARPRLWANLWLENGAATPRLLTKVINPMPLPSPAVPVG
jgi:hypothetical protein